MSNEQPFLADVGRGGDGVVGRHAVLPETLDRFFLLFALAFAIDAAVRVALGLSTPSAEIEPLFYSARLLTFGLIIVAIALKNRARKDRE